MRILKAAALLCLLCSPALAQGNSGFPFAVKGPNSSTSGHIATFNGTSGQVIQDGGAVPTPATTANVAAAIAVNGAVKSNGSTTFGQAACADLSNGGTGCSATISNYAPLASPTFTGTVSLPSGATDTTSGFAPSQTKGIIGTTTNNNAQAGSVGEYVTATQGTPQSITNNSPIDITSISLTAGDWDVTGSIDMAPDGGTTMTQFIGWTSTSSATLPSFPNGGGISVFTSSSVGGVQYFSVGPMRLSLTTTTTVYLSCQAAFTGSTNGCAGFIRARRIR